MPEPDAAQQLIEEHIATLGEQKAQLERALGHLQGSTGGKAKALVAVRVPGPGEADRPRVALTAAELNAPHVARAAVK